jgi:hypothetical protein
MLAHTNHLHLQRYCHFVGNRPGRAAAYLHVSRLGCHHCRHCVNGAWRLLAQQPPQHCNVPTSSSCTGKQPDDQQHTFSTACSATAAVPLEGCEALLMMLSNALARLPSLCAHRIRQSYRTLHDVEGLCTMRHLFLHFPHTTQHTPAFDYDLCNKAAV